MRSGFVIVLLLAPVAFADLVTLHSNYRIAGASYNSGVGDGFGFANMSVSDRTGDFLFAGGAMEGPITAPYQQSPAFGIWTSASLDSEEQTDASIDQLWTPFIYWQGGLPGAVSVDIEVSGPTFAGPVAAGTYGVPVTWSASASGCIGYVDELRGDMFDCSFSLPDAEAAFPPDEFLTPPHYVENYFSASGSGTGIATFTVEPRFGDLRISDFGYGLIDPTSVPEPASAVLLGIGCLVLFGRKSKAPGLWRRCRATQQAPVACRGLVYCRERDGKATGCH